MTATEQTFALFTGIAGVLIVASLIGLVLQRRYASEGPNPVIENCRLQDLASAVCLERTGTVVMTLKGRCTPSCSVTDT